MGKDTTSLLGTVLRHEGRVGFSQVGLDGLGRPRQHCKQGVSSLEHSVEGFCVLGSGLGEAEGDVLVVLMGAGPGVHLRWTAVTTGDSVAIHWGQHLGMSYIIFKRIC